MEETIMGIPKYDLGNILKIRGMVLQGGDTNHIIMFPNSDKLNEVNIIEDTSQEDWKKLFYQLDTLEAVLFHGNPEAKIVVRKSQRNIEAGLSWNVFRRDSYTCRYCANDKVALTIDHLLLWEKMGPTVEENLISACSKCNGARGNMEFGDWIKSDYYNKRISKFLDPEQAHTYNMNLWEIAKNLPLRESLRNR